MNTINRIKAICEKEGITITSLEKLIGASKGVLSRALNKNTDIQSKWISKIVENYPLYNPEWLLTGKGSMLKSDQKGSTGDCIEQEKEIKHLQEMNEMLQYTVEVNKKYITNLEKENKELKSALEKKQNISSNPTKAIE